MGSSRGLSSFMIILKGQYTCIQPHHNLQNWFKLIVSQGCACCSLSNFGMSSHAYILKHFEGSNGQLEGLVTFLPPKMCCNNVDSLNLIDLNVLELQVYMHLNLVSRPTKPY